MSLDLKDGDLLTIDWLCLDGKPQSSYRIIKAAGNRIWYYRVGTERILDVTTDGIESCVRRGELAIKILHQLPAQA